MQFSDIATLRLAAQHITTPDMTSAQAVASHMVAMQAQDYAGAIWAIGLRTPSLTFSDIEQAIADHMIVRTWPMRGTLHFLAADDARWVTQLLAPRKIQAGLARERTLLIDENILQQSRKIISSALQGGKSIARTAFLELLEQNNIATANQRGYHILWRLAQEGLICFGPHQGKQPTFVLMNEWLPNARQLGDRTDALGELAGRYFISHGPASLKDFAGWAGITMTDAKIGIQQAGSSIAQTQVNGIDYWHSPDVAVDNNTRSAFLLPGFDEFMLGYKDRTPALATEHASKIVPGNNGVFLPTIVVDGQVVGTWKKTVRKNDITITLDPFRQLDDTSLELLHVAASRYSQFARLPAQII